MIIPLYFKSLISFLFNTKGIFFKILLLTVFIKTSFSQSAGVNFQTNHIGSEIYLQEQSSINTTDTSLARRIKEKQDASILRANFKPGIAVATSTGQPEQDCNSAIPVCQNIYYTSASYIGVGNIDEIPGGSSCLISNEKNSVWYTFSTGSSGNLAFEISPNDLLDDYDFALYDITGNNCSGITSGAIIPVRCNFSASSGSTGLSNSTTSANQSPILATTPGKTYVLIINNYSATQSGYTLDFSSNTASIFDNTPPTIQNVSAPCGSNTITIDLSEQVKCASIAANGSDFTITGAGGPYSVSSAVGVNCGTNSGSIILSISPLFNGAGPWTLDVLTGSDGNTVTDACGNDMTVSSFTFNLAPPNISVTGNAAICLGGSTSLTALGADTYTWSTGSNSNSITVTPTVNTTYTVTGNITSLGCSATVTKTITVFTNSIGISPTTQTICQGSIATLTGIGVQTYTWSSGSNAGTLAVQPSVTTTYSLTGNNSCGTYTSSAIVNVTPISGTITSSPSLLICKGSSTTLTATGGTSYTWSPSTGLSSTNTAIVVASPTTSTIYSLTLTSSNGCTRTYTQFISVYSNSIGISPTTQTICQGSSALLSGVGAQTYSWSTFDITSNIVVAPVTNTTYTLTGTNVCGTYTTSTLVHVLPIFGSITSSPSFSICKGSSTTLTASGGTSYTWSPSTALSSTNTAVVVASPTATTNYYLTVSNASGCTRSYVQTIAVYTNSIGISPTTQTVCQGSGATLLGSGAQTYTWSTGAISSSILVLPTVTTTYTLTGKNSCGMFTSSATVSVSPISGAITSSPSFSICKGSSTTLTASGGTSYAWSPSTALSSINTPVTIASPTSAIVYSLTITNAFGCIKTYTKTISVYTNSVIVTPPSALICKGSSATISGSGAQTYTWSTGSNSPSITVTPSVNTTYSLSSKNVCGTFLSTVTITVSIISPTITSSPSFSICYGKSTSLTATGGTSYTWSPGTSLSSTTSAVTVASPSVSTIYTLIATNAFGCTKTNTTFVLVVPNYTVLSSALQPSICMGKNSVLSVSGASNYTWAPSSGLSATTGASVVASPSITTVYTITSSDAFGCIKYHAQSLYIYPDFNINIENLSAENCANKPIDLTTNVSPTGINNYTWSPNTLLSDNHVYNPVLTTNSSGQYKYTVSVTDQNNCVKNDSINIVVVLCEIKIYSGFSPNSDTHNDTWIIDGIERESNNKVSILNKWGQLVWETETYNNVDRVFKGNNQTGEALTDGTYFYVLTTLNKTYKGRVEIIR